MHRVNDLLGKQVINQASGERIAAISDVVFAEDMSAVIALLLGGSGLFSQPRAARWGTIKSIGDVVVAEVTHELPSLRDDEIVKQLHEANFKISGVPLIGADGKRVGTVSNVFFDDAGRVVGYEIDPGGLFIGRKFLPIAQVQKVGRDALLANDSTLVSLKDAEQSSTLPTSGEAAPVSTEPPLAGPIDV